ncbi:MAG TPA: hypothetical protein VK629_14465 [Steroidobacteraceae bacterium]|nr:hypothetical protein [Steroidobacteraceae bacterium]
MANLRDDDPESSGKIYIARSKRTIIIALYAPSVSCPLRLAGY